MYHYLVAHVGGVKLFGTISISAIFGVVLEIITGTTPQMHPALVSAVVGGAVAVVIKLIDLMWDNRKTKKQAKEKEHVTADKVLEIEQQDKRELREGMKALHAQELEFWQRQCTEHEGDARDARTRAHSAVTQLISLQNHVLTLQQKLAAAGVEIPPFTFTPYTELMMTHLNKHGVDESNRVFAEREKERNNVHQTQS